MKRFTRMAVGTALLLGTWSLPGSGEALVEPNAFRTDFCSGEYEDFFEDLRNEPLINDGVDLGGTGHCAVNVTGGAGPAGDTWLTAFRPGRGEIFNARDGGLCVGVDVLINRYNNAKGAGPMALVNPEASGLLLLLEDNGNSDWLTLNVVNVLTGKLTQVAKSYLGNSVAENTWYRLELIIGGPNDFFEALVYRHVDGTDPNSGVQTQTLTGGRILLGTPPTELNLSTEGLVGLGASAKSAVVNSSFTNFSAATGCARK